MMRKVVAGVEDTSEARSALRFARMIAEASGADLNVAAVFSKTLFADGPEGAERSKVAYFDEMETVARDELGAALEIDRLIGSSVPAALTRAVEEEAADLLVIGSSHRGIFGRVLMGDVGFSLATALPCAMAVVPRGWVQTEGQLPETVGIAYDGTPESELALNAGVDIAAACQSKVRLVGVIPKIRNPGRIGLTDEPFEEVLLEEAHKSLVEASSRKGLADADLLVRVGDTVDELTEESSKLDVLVMGSRSYGPLGRLLLGGASLGVTRSAACPVIVVPRGD